VLTVPSPEHFKFHYEIMLGVKLKTERIVTSAPDGGGDPCCFEYTILK